MSATKVLDENNKWVIKDDNNEINNKVNNIVKQLTEKMPNLGYIEDVLDTSIRFGVGVYNAETANVPDGSKMASYGTAIFFPLADSYAGHHVILIGNWLVNGSRIAIASYVNNSWITNWQYVPVDYCTALTQKVLWQGAWHMSNNHRAELSEKISEQKNGVVLMWSAYSNNQAQNYDWHSFFVPKTWVNSFQGNGMDFPLFTTTFGNVASKYIYFYDDYLLGHSNNAATGTGSSGITYKNGYWVLRYVIGV